MCVLVPEGTAAPVAVAVPGAVVPGVAPGATAPGAAVALAGASAHT
ncbi:hypothetical protein [Halomarina pelagica]|nr:hypothetical protein [Halomarina sp. BND7]